jgi:uncharacterized membrane protein
MPAELSENTFEERLVTEVAAWERDRLIRKATGQALLARYGLASSETAAAIRRAQMALTLGIMGAVLVGVGAIILLGPLWTKAVRPLLFACLVAGTCASYAAGYVLGRVKRSAPKVGDGLMLLGGFFGERSRRRLIASMHDGATPPAVGGATRGADESSVGRSGNQGLGC